MTAKQPDDVCSKGNIEVASSVIANWLENEQPRARMARYRAAQMSTAELLALCMVSGLLGENAVLLSQRILKEFGSVHALLAAPIQQSLAVRGVGLAKAARKKAIHERSVRETAVQLKCAQSFNEPEAVAGFLRKCLGHLGYEAFGFYFSTPSLNILPSRFCFEDPMTAPM